MVFVARFSKFDYSPQERGLRKGAIVTSYLLPHGPE